MKSPQGEHLHDKVRPLGEVLHIYFHFSFGKRHTSSCKTELAYRDYNIVICIGLRCKTQSKDNCDL